MSQSHSHSSAQSHRPALGSRENFFAHDSDEDEADYESVDPPSQRGPTYGVSKEAWFSKSILLKYGSPVLLCPRCLHQHGRPVELSDPVDYIPPSQTIEVDVSSPDEDDVEWVPFSDQDEPLGEFDDSDVRKLAVYTDHRRHRHCPGCGHYTWGGLLQDRPREEFMEIVRITVDEIYGVVSRRDAYIENASDRKGTGPGSGIIDVKNHRKLIRELELADPEFFDSR